MKHIYLVLSVLIAVIISLFLPVGSVLATTLPPYPGGPLNTPWGAQLDYDALRGCGGTALFDVGFPNFNLGSQVVDIYTGSGGGPSDTYFPADPTAYFNGFLAGQPITFRNKLTNTDTGVCGSMDNFYYGVSKVIACDGYPCSNTDSACYDLIKYDLDEATLSSCSSAGGKEPTHQTPYFRFPASFDQDPSCAAFGRPSAALFCFDLQPQQTLELGVDNLYQDDPRKYLWAADTTWTPAETGYYQYDLHTKDGTEVHAAGFIKVIPPITGSISGPNLGTVGQALTYTGNGFGTGVNKVELYYSPTPSQSWSLIKSCTATTTCTGSWTPTAIGTYYVVVNAYNTNLQAQCSGNPWTPLPPGWQNCGTNDVITLTVSNPSMPPAITSLQVNNADANQSGGFTGIYGITGPQVSQEGKNWLNPLSITLNATPGTNPIANYFVAFYNKTAPSAPFPYIVNIPALTPSDYFKNLQAYDYFILRYASSGRYYVWDPGTSSWFDITGNLLGKLICGPAGCKTQLYYTAFPGNTLGNPPNPSLPYSWNIRIDKNFGDKNLYTAVNVIDSVYLSTFLPDINPVP